MITEITNGKGTICAEILAMLPEWFGIPEANAAHIREVEMLTVFGAFEGGRPVGFLALKQHTPFAAEIYVMGVRPERHRRGNGRALIEHAQVYLRGRGLRFLTVKTIAPSSPDPRYAGTRAFYEGVGFVPLELFPLLWNAQNPALMMVKTI